MNAPERICFLPDIQASPDHRRLAIQQVGVKGLRYPLTLLDAAGEAHPTIATLTMSVGLPPEVKGTHMSRFVELLERPRPALSLHDLRQMFAEMLLHLQADSGRIELRFPISSARRRRSRVCPACSTSMPASMSGPSPAARWKWRWR
jgi:GTP cyclohydrolase I